MKVSSYRDLTIMTVTHGLQLVVACDSSASIGHKEYDAVKIDPEIVAACCLRVPLFELICVGAKPNLVVDMIGNEYDTTGKKMISGIQSELKKAELENLPINGSTEENMLTQMSSLGITVIGEIEGKFIQPIIHKNDYLYQLGQPYVGNEVIANLDSLCDYNDLYQLKSDFSVIDMLPVGSKGIKYESQILARDNELEIEFYHPNDETLKRSAGPSTVVLVVVLEKEREKFNLNHTNVVEIGQFK
ncbi:MULTISPECIES: AIR synthase related protein [Vagococcus]|nr:MULTISPECIES: AIR synthase related protein [Vagococcus]HCM89662.1 hypothetical protein [Vagococcus sp.]